MLALTFWFIHVPFLVFLYSKGSKFTFSHVDIKFFQPRVQKGQFSPASCLGVPEENQQTARAVFGILHGLGDRSPAPHYLGTVSLHIYSKL